MGAWEELRELVEQATGPEGLRSVLTHIDKALLARLAEECWRLRLLRHGRELQAFRPGVRFPAISITGTRCELRCKYCSGRYLKGMIPAETPEELWRVCVSLAERGAEGVLLSGGYTREAVLPIRPFLRTLRAIKEQLGLTLAIHPGLVDYGLAEELAAAGVDIALCELIGDRATVREALGIDRGPEDYMASLLALREAGVPYLAPHVCLGIWGGELAGELNALKIAREAKPEVLVLIVFIPTRGTPYADRRPPELADVAKLMAISRLMFPDVPVALGCMRPRRPPYRERLDVMAVELGLNRIALPARAAVRAAEERGLAVKWRDVCCAVP